MKGRNTILFILWMASILTIGWAQRSPFSLQAAVDELHRQEYPLNAPPGQQPGHYMAGAFAASPDQDYWDEEAAYTINTKKQRNRLNKQLAKFLERESYDADHGGLTLGPFGGYEFDEDSNRLTLPQYSDERKRSSVFRERSNLYEDGPQSIFRERDIPEGPADRSELTDQFLREIERTQEHGREERYKEALRNLWDKYQQQENELEGDVYEEQKKRMRMPPYYMLMQKKRSYPVLPWLPYSAERKKRFPVAKRSAPHVASEGPVSGMGKTDENVERELSELFGTSTDEKKKRSIDDKHSKTPTAHGPQDAVTSVSDMRLETNKNATAEDAAKSVATGPVTQATEEHHSHAGHSMAEHKHGKRSNHPTSRESREDEGEEEEEDSDEEHESEEEDEEHEHDHEHEHEDEEEVEAKRKKKRDASPAKRKRNVAELRRTMDDLTIMRSKKSIDWSKYFGLDRKKKAMAVADATKEIDMKKRDAEEDSGAPSDDMIKKKKRNIDPAKLENMNKKLQAIEDFIINETIKYTGAHEGIGDPEEIQRLKDRVLSRLATAYSLEKMRRALEKLRQSVENENHLMLNMIESDTSDSSENNSLEVAKKDKLPTQPQGPVDDKNNNEDFKRKAMKKSNGYMRYPEIPNEFGDLEEPMQSPNRYETLNDAYLGNKNYIMGTNQCPIIESMAQRCRGVDLLSGDLNQELLPLCGVHQLCYLCGTSQIACDYQYLAEADAVCGNINNDCQAAARSVLMILRGTPGPQLGPRECVKNSCLYSAMREIGL